jgi:hypothetical protein
MSKTLVKKVTVKTGHNLGRTSCGRLGVQGYLEGEGGWTKEKYASVSMQVTVKE